MKKFYNANIIKFISLFVVLSSLLFIHRSHVRLFVTPIDFSISGFPVLLLSPGVCSDLYSLVVMSHNHLILCHPLLPPAFNHVCIYKTLPYTEIYKDIYLFSLLIVLNSVLHICLIFLEFIFDFIQHYYIIQTLFNKIHPFSADL